MFKILILAIFLMGNAFGEFNISNIKLTPTELEIVGDSLEDIQSVTIVSKDSSKEFEIENLSSNQVIARPLDKTMIEGLTLNLVITDSLKEETYPITISQKNGLVTFYKLQEKESDYKPVVNSQNKVVLGHESEINFLPGENSTSYDYNYSLYANPTGDFAIKGKDKDLFTIDDKGNVEISGTLKIKGKQIGFNIPYKPTNELAIPTNSNSANKVVFSTGASLAESGYTIPMNICPKGQILKSDGINFVCSLEASQEDQLGPVYTNQKSNLGIDQIYRELQINNLVIDSSGNITGALNFTSLGIMDVATNTFHVATASGGRVGIGTAAPSVKLDIIGAVDSGIHLKQGGPSTPTGTTWRNGLVLENSTDLHAVSIGYGAGDLFSFISYNGTAPKTVFTLDYNGNGVIVGNLKIGAYILPAADGVSGTVLRTNGSGTVTWDPIVAGSVNGPGTTIVGNVAYWNNTTGTLLADGGILAANLVTNNASSTDGFVATFAGGTGKIIKNGTKLEADLVTGPATASGTNLASFSNATGKVIQDSGITSTNVMTMGSNAVAGANVLASIIGTKSAVESTIPIANIPTMILPTAASNTLIVAEGTTKALKSTPYSVPINICSNGQTWQSNGTNMVCSAGSAGDVVGPATASINALARFATADGKSIQNSPVLLDNAGALTGILSINGKTAVDLVTMPTPASSTSQVMLSAGAGKALAPADYKFPSSSGTTGQVLKLINATDATWQTVGGGDVNGPLSSGDNQLAVFDGITGKLLKAVPLVYLNIVTNVASSTVPNHVAIFDSATGKSIADSGILYTDLVTGPAGTTQDNLASFSDASGDKIKNSGILSTNVVTNTAAATANAIARFDTASGKLIKNSTVIIDDAGNLTGVGTINGNSSANIVTMAATPTFANQVYLSNGLDKIAKTTSYTFPVGPCAQDYILKTDVSGNFQCVAAATSGVVSFIGRTGAVVAVAGDYNAGQVNSTPTGFVAATNVQAAITELDTEKVPAAGGTMTGPLSVTEVRYLESPGTDYVGFKAPASLAADTIWILPPADGTSNTVLTTDGNKNLSWRAVSGGDVTGPGTSTDNAIARFDQNTGKIIQNSVVTIDDAGVMAGVTTFTTTGPFTFSGDVNVTGNLTAQSYTNTSDRNLKKDITPFSGGGDLIDKLMPVSFRWKKGNDRPVIGLIAQDVEKVLPDVVTITKGKDGAIRSYDLGQVLALTIEALKETRAEVKMLEEKIKKLEQKNRKKGE